jgi:arginyl-tRNA synthetase
MQYAFDRFRTEIAHALLNTGLVAPEEIELGPPTARGVQADLALPCFKAAKRRRDGPARLAQQVAAEVGASIGQVARRRCRDQRRVRQFPRRRRALAIQTLDEIQRHGDRYGWEDRARAKLW